MISRRAKLSAVTVLSALIAMSTVGCQTGGHGFKFPPNFRCPKLRLPSFPCKLRRPNHEQAVEATCGCDACQQNSGLPMEDSSQFDQAGPGCTSCANGLDQTAGQSFSTYPESPDSTQPLNEYNTPEPREQFGPYNLPEGDLEVPATPVPSQKQELFIVPEDGQFKPQTDNNAFEARTAPEPSFRKTVTSPVQKALTSTGDFQPNGDLNLKDFKPVEMAPKTNELKAAFDSAKSELNLNVQKTQTDLANELDPLAFQAPEPLMNDPVEEVVDEILEAAEAKSAPVPETQRAEMPAPVPAPAPAPAPMPAPVPAPMPVPKPAVPPAPQMAVEVPAPPRFQAEAGEEIYGAILFDKRIEDNLRKEDQSSVGTVLTPQVEMEIPKTKKVTAPPVTKAETQGVTRVYHPPADQGVIHIKRQINPQTDPVVLRAFSSERSVNPTLRPKPTQVKQVSTVRATAPVYNTPRATGDFIIKSLPAPPAEPSESEEYEFRSVPNFQIPVLRANPATGNEQSRFKIRVDSTEHPNSTYCESCATKLNDDIGPIMGTNPQTDQRHQYRPLPQQQQRQQSSMYFEHEANSNALAYPTLR